MPSLTGHFGLPQASFQSHPAHPFTHKPQKKQQPPGGTRFRADLHKHITYTAWIYISHLASNTACSAFLPYKQLLMKSLQMQLLMDSEPVSLVGLSPSALS